MFSNILVITFNSLMQIVKLFVNFSKLPIISQIFDA